MEKEDGGVTNVKVEDDCSEERTSIIDCEDESLVKLLPSQASKLRFPPGCGVVYMDSKHEPPVVVYDTVEEVYLDLGTRQGVYCLKQHPHLFCPEHTLHFTRNVEAWALFDGRQVPVIVLKSHCCALPAIGIELSPSALYSVQEVESKVIHHSLLAQDLVFRNPTNPQPPPVPFLTMISAPKATSAPFATCPDSSSKTCQPFCSEETDSSKLTAGPRSMRCSIDSPTEASANSQSQKSLDVGSRVRKRDPTDFLCVNGELPSKRKIVDPVPNRSAQPPTMIISVPEWAATAKLRDLLLSSLPDLERTHSCCIQVRGKFFGETHADEHIIVKVLGSSSAGLRRDVENVIVSQQPHAAQLLLMHDLAKRNNPNSRGLCADNRFFRHWDPCFRLLKWSATVNLPWARDGDLARGAIIGPSGIGIRAMDDNRRLNCSIKVMSQPRLVILISGGKLAHVKECFERAKARVRWASQRFDVFNKP